MFYNFVFTVEGYGKGNYYGGGGGGGYGSYSSWSSYSTPTRFVHIMGNFLSNFRVI